MPGYKQKLLEAQQCAEKKARGGESLPTWNSPFASELLKLWSTGHLSAIGLQKLAAAALLDGVTHALVADLACLGNWGQCPGNVSRDLHKFAAKDMKLPEAITITCPCLQSKATPPLQDSKFAVLPPHMLFWSLSKHYGEQWEALLGSTKIVDFWSRVAMDDPRLKDNPMTAIPDFREKFLPLWLHRDGVEFSTDSILAYSCGSLLSTGSSMDSSFLLAAWPKSATARLDHHGADTWKLPIEVLIWSFQALW